MLADIAREKRINRREFSNDEIVERILAAMVNEGARVLEEGIAQRASDIDVTFVFGYGFPKYRGGPMFWAESQGLGRVLETVRKIHAERGDRWKPAALLETCAQAGNGWRREGTAGVQCRRSDMIERKR